ncbi:agmatine deiminase family protein [Paraburkholderia sp. D15]|uniref:agmatine deiminase family protein n=1 Tax=Paraburkholderia sp. D15 TaxID=2880218 RepID=UPI0024798A0E|nr:agmatine deiminase family protein [Paraburkholderia sp. D15]WGS50588.1 agmatine deiminase family protein [Paraburkholderia sp. D15]
MKDKTTPPLPLKPLTSADSPLSRRGFIKGSATLFGASLMGALAGCGGADSPASSAAERSFAARPLPNPPAYLMPAENATHKATYMAFASGSEGIWTPVTPQSTDAGIDRVRSDLMDVAKAIGTYEPVNMLVLPVDLSAAQNLLAVPSGANPDIHANYVARGAGVGGVNLIPLANGFDDLWTRDTGAIFVKDTANGNALGAVSFNFSGWGNANTDGQHLNPGMTVPPSVTASSNKSKAGKYFQPFAKDHTLASWMAQANNATLIQSTLTLEGGAIEFDGEATAILTESAVLHVNRNPQLFNIPNGVVANATLLPGAKATVLAELQRTLGVRKIIWIPGTAIYPRGCGAGGKGGAATPAKETDITNGHVDFYAKFLAPGVVVYCYDAPNSMGERALTEANWEHLNNQTDASGRTLQLIELDTPANYGTSNGVTLNNSQLTNFAVGYVNFYTCNGAIIMPKFNDADADYAAWSAIQPYAGGRDIVQVDILGIASGGGGIHCATRELPA